MVENGAARLFEQFEKEAKHRREMESSSLHYQGRDLVQGKKSALLFGGGVLFAFCFAIWMGAEWAAVVLGAGLLTTIAITFHRIFGDKEQNSTKKEDPPVK